MATRDLIPEAFDNDDAQLRELFDAVDEIGTHDVATTNVNGHVVDQLVIDPLEMDVLPVEIPAPATISGTIGLLFTVVGDQVRHLGRRLDRRTVLRLLGQGVSIAGVLLLALAVFEGFIGGITEQRDQRELRGAYQKLLTAQGGFAEVTKGNTRIIPNGTPVASIEIPKIGLRRIVAEGTTSDDLRKGPGHLRSTPLPGQHGNAVIAARRTTYGGAFGDIGKLDVGDPINVTTPFGNFRYVVHDVATLRPGAPDRLGATMTNILTLTTSDPPFRANKRLVVVARLDGAVSKYVDPLRQTKVGTQEGSFFGDPSKAFPALFWELMVFAALMGSRVLYGRWHRWPTYLLTMPIILAVIFAWLQAMVGLLPSTL